METKRKIKRWLSAAMSLSVVLFVYCTENSPLQAKTSSTNSNATTGQGKVLVAYFSRANYVPEGTDGVTGATNKAGNTQTVAEYISRKTGGTLFEIIPERSYPVSHTECSAIAQQEYRDNVRPALKSHVENMEEYSTVFVGFPIWVYREPMAVLTFLEEYDFKGKTVIPFCTSMAVGIEQSEKDFREALPGAEVKHGLRIGYTLSGSWQNDVDTWLKETGINQNSSQQQEIKLRLTVKGQSLTATLLDNATTRAFMAKLPLTLPMMDLYNREMCYRFPEALPTDNVHTTGYEVGEIVYYPPMHSFVIMYAQNGEHFSMQKLGRIDSGVGIFNGIGDVDVTFEQASPPSSVKSVRNAEAAIHSVGNQVVIESKDKITATLYDAGGRTLDKTTGIHRLELHAGSYKGTAIVEMRSDKNSVKKKIIIR